MQGPVVLVIGTRPEGIKMIPVYYAFKRAGIETIICSTAQHDFLLDEVFDVFGLKPDINLKIMKPGQDLFYITQEVLGKIKKVFQELKPSLVLVQGDTTTVMTAALAAFYLKIPVGHVEAGLRTGDIRSPFPEEMNRKVVTVVSDYNFVPTIESEKNLLKENVDPEKVFCTGNTVVDALRIMKEKINLNEIDIDKKVKKAVSDCKEKSQQLVLLTAHRRESFGGGIERILSAIKAFAQDHPEVFIFYPYHPNPNVVNAINSSTIKTMSNVYLTEPIAYKEMIYLLLNSSWIATDSGGIQEEAVSLGKQVIVLREKTERPEGVAAGLAHVVGTDENKIKKMMEKLSVYRYNLPNKFMNIYGDGYAAEKIVSICIQKMLDQKS